MTNYFKTKGYTSTIVQHDSHKDVNSVEWNADYDGHKANVDLKLGKNGKRKHINMELNNQDLLELLNAQSVRKPLDMRLRDDFSTFRKSAQNQLKTRKRRRGSRRGGSRRGGSRRR